MPRLPASRYEIAIPSYQRPDTLTRHTLPWLRAGGVDLARVTVFNHDADPDAAGRYAALIRDHGARQRITGVQGIAAQRRLISRHYEPGTPVVCLDDDVTALVKAPDPKHLEPVTDLDHWFRRAFIETAGADLNVWGVNAVVNPFMMNPGRPPSTGLKFAIATCWGFYSRPGHPVHHNTVPVKEDYELSLRAWWYDGGLLRFDDHAVRADHYRIAGGCQQERTPEVSKRAADKLMQDWPGLVRLNPRRKGEHAEILLASRRRHTGKPASASPPGIVA